MTRIETHRQRAPWSWVAFMTFPWLALYYIENVSGAPLTFTLRKFVENPALIAFLTSLNVAFNFMVGMVSNYMSDRIWTRWGRRRPFLIVGWLGAASSLVFIPLAPNLGTLVVLIVAFQFFADIAKPVEPLYNEVVPPLQRGRGATIRSIAQQLMGLFFFGIMVSQFDRVHDLEAFGRSIRINGETALYWTGAAIVLAVTLFVAFGVRETPPPERVVRERFSLRAFFRDIFGRRQWWMIYLLYVTPTLAGAGAGGFLPLVKTEQLGFSRAQFGYATMIGLVGLIVIFIPVSGYLADRVPRLRLFQFGLIAPAIVEFLFFIYLRYYADYSISLATLIVFGVVAAGLKMCLYTVWGPLMFDYIPSDRFGTVSAGLTFVGGLAPFLTINLAGFWVTGFTRVFGTAGESEHDYSSVYLLQLAGSALALLLTFYFVRQEKLGRVLPLGKQEFEKTS